jgi:hypothetical protein
VIAKYKHYSLFGLVISNEEKRFKTLIPGKIFHAILMYGIDEIVGLNMIVLSQKEN